MIIKRLLIAILCVFSSTVFSVIPGSYLTPDVDDPQQLNRYAITRQLYTWDVTNPRTFCTGASCWVFDFNGDDQIDCSSFETTPDPTRDNCFVPISVPLPSNSFHRDIYVWGTFNLAYEVAYTAETAREYYREPGLQPAMATDSATQQEQVYPFSGLLQINHVDLQLPGNGSLDLAVTRSYVGTGLRAEFDVNGIYWTQHFGRIKVAAGYRDEICNHQFANAFDENASNIPSPPSDGYGIGSNIGNPVLEHADGRREILFNNGIDNDGSLITKSNWKAECIDSSNSDAGMYLFSPDGVRYQMDVISLERMTKHEPFDPVAMAPEREDEYLDRTVVSAFMDPSSITDLNGNSITLTYGLSNLNDLSEFYYLELVNTNDGRMLDYQYTFDGVGYPKLTSVTDGTRVVSYEYESVVQPSGAMISVDQSPTHLLKKVVRVDGSEWNYQYGLNSASNDYLMLTGMDYPSGLRVDYGYDTEIFSQIDYTFLDEPFGSTFTAADLEAQASVVVVSAKTLSGPDVPSAAWNYDYQPGWTRGVGLDSFDMTVIDGPENRREIEHYGISSVAGFNTSMNAIGLPYLDRSFALGDTSPIRQLSYVWTERYLSHEWYMQHDFGDAFFTQALIAEGVAVADLSTISETLADSDDLASTSSTSTIYADYDSYGNPQLITETSFSGTGSSDRVSHLTYLNDPQKWLLGLEQSRSIDTLGAITQNYDSQGNLLGINRFGVNTTRTYTPQGDLASVRDATGINGVNYANYHRGQAQSITFPGSLDSISQTVNDSGTIASVTNGRGHTTSYSYTALNQIDSINLPIHLDIDYIWSYAPNQLEVKRGVHTEIVKFDALNRPLQNIVTNTVSNISSLSTNVYDAAGQLVFESLPNSSLGSTYQYDAIGRLLSISHPGGIKTFDHSASSVTSTDENGNSIKNIYWSLGSFSNWVGLTTQVFDNGSSAVSYARNMLGQITQIVQGDYVNGNTTGYPRTYKYNSKYFLQSAQEVEVYPVTYTQDAVGNILTATLNSPTPSVKRYGYDTHDRLTSIDYEDNSLDATFSYYPDGSLQSESNSQSSRSYIYDANNNLIREDITIASDAYALQYSPNNYDHIDSVTYPSSRVISFSPDPQGRPTQATPYVTGISYRSDGLPATISYANGHTSSYGFNSRLLLDSVAVNGASSAFGNSFNALDKSYLYDAAGNIDLITNNENSLNTAAFSYDQQSRINTATGNWGSGTYTYDNVQNITSRSGINTTDDVYTHNAMWLSDINSASTGVQRFYGYDADGNIIIESVEDAAVVVKQKLYGFDQAGNLSSVEVNEGVGSITESNKYLYSYDTQGHRISRTHQETGSNSQFVYNNDGLLMGEYLSAGQLLRENYYLGRQLIASVQDLPPNLSPSPDAGSDATIQSGSTVGLDGAGSSDTDGIITRYEWVPVNAAAQSLVLTGADTASASFDIPVDAIDGTVYEFELRLNDNRGGTAVDTVIYTVLSNALPNALLTPLTSTINSGTSESRTLYATSSSDAETPFNQLTFSWTQENGTPVVFNNTDQPQVTISFPEYLASDEEIIIRVVVSDTDGGADSAIHTLTVKANSQPTVDAGPDMIVFPGEEFNLNATTVDAQGLSSLSWYGPPDKRSFSGGATANRYFTLEVFDTDLLGQSLWTESWEARVTDSQGAQESDFVTVALVNPAIDSDLDSLPDGWETFYFGDITSNSGAEDADEDGLTVVEEYQLRLNPNISDSVPEPVADFKGYAGNAENRLYWHTDGYETNFDLYWSNTPITDITAAILISDVASPYSHTSLSNSSPYYYQVVSKNSVNTSTPSTEIMLTPSQSEWQGESLISNSETYFYSESNGYRVYAWVENMEETTGYYYLPARFKLYAKVFSYESGWGETLLIRESEFYPQETKITISEQGYIALSVGYEGRKVSTGVSDEVSFHALSLDKTRWITHGKYTLPDNSGLSISAPKIALDGRAYYGTFWTKGSPFTPRAYLVTGKISNSASGSWSASYPITINPDGAQLFYPEIEIELGANNSVHVVWAEHYSGGRTMFATLFDTVAGTLGANTVIRSSNGSFGDFRMLANSNSDVALLFYEAANGYLKAKSIYYDSNAGTWGNITSVPAPKGGKTSVKFITASKLQSGLIYASLVKGVEVYTLTSDFAGNWSAPVILPIVEKDALNMEESSPDNMWICSREPTGIKITQHNLQTDQLTELDTGLFVSDSDAGFGCAKGLFGDDINVAYSNEGGLYLNQFKAPANEALNTAPTSNAGVDIAILPGEIAALVGSGQDAEDSNLIYNWYQTGGPGASFIGSSIPSSSSSVNIFYGQFPSDGNYWVTLRTTDPYGVYGEDEVIISVNVNAPPIADAGQDQIIDPGITATLDGSTSSDPGGTIVSYQWTQLTGTAVTLVDASTATASFDTGGLGAGEVLTFELSVTDDGGLVSTDATTVTMTSPNQPPVADAGPDVNINLGATAVLDGSNSSDSDGTIVSYQWQKLSGIPVSLQNATTATASFVTNGLVGGELLTFELTVTDNNGAIATDQIALTIVSDTIAPVTTLQSTRYKSKGKTYFDLTLTPNESATSYFRVTGEGNVTVGGSDTTAWQTYTVPVTVKLAGNNAVATFEYYSEDTAGNTEVTQQEILQ
jgi:YD repeat-containing protein